MKTCRIPFADLPWQTSPAGVRYKLHRDGARHLRLLEFTPDLVHPHWCVAGHLGYVIEGAMEIEFDDRVETYRAGDGVHIPSGPGDRHRPRALSERVRLIFVEDAREP